MNPIPKIVRDLIIELYENGDNVDINQFINDHPYSNGSINSLKELLVFESDQAKIINFSRKYPSCEKLHKLLVGIDVNSGTATTVQPASQNAHDDRSDQLNTAEQLSSLVVDAHTVNHYREQWMSEDEGMEQEDLFKFISTFNK